MLARQVDCIFCYRAIYIKGKLLFLDKIIKGGWGVGGVLIVLKQGATSHFMHCLFTFQEHNLYSFFSYNAIKIISYTL